MTDCDPTLGDCPVVEEVSMEMGDFGEYVEDGFGQ